MEDAIDENFAEKAVGDVASVEGSLDKAKYNAWCMKDSGYVAKIMGTPLGLCYLEERLRHCVLMDRQVDDHKNKCQCSAEYPGKFVL